MADLLSLIASGGRQETGIVDKIANIQNLRSREVQLQLEREKTQTLLQDLAITRQQKQQTQDVISTSQAEALSIGGTVEQQQENFRQIASQRSLAIGRPDIVQDITSDYYKQKQIEQQATTEARQTEQFSWQKTRATVEDTFKKRDQDLEGSRQKLMKEGQEGVMKRSEIKARNDFIKIQTKTLSEPEYIQTKLTSILPNILKTATYKGRKLGDTFGTPTKNELEALAGLVQLRAQGLAAAQAFDEDATVAPKNTDEILVQAIQEALPQYITMRDRLVGTKMDVTVTPTAKQEELNSRLDDILRR